MILQDQKTIEVHIQDSIQLIEVRIRYYGRDIESYFRFCIKGITRDWKPGTTEERAPFFLPFIPAL
jgi:hypothetical protein